MHTSEQASVLVSKGTLKAISSLGSDLSFGDDVLPAFREAKFESRQDQASIRQGRDFISFYAPRTADHIAKTLEQLDLTRVDIVDRLLQFTRRIARVFAVGSKADPAKLMRLANAIGDDARRIETGANLAVEAIEADMAVHDARQMGGSVAKVTINKAGIAKMMRDLQREFDKHPIQVPVNADAPELQARGGTTSIYHGPVIMGDANNAQLAWGNQTAHQTQNRTEQIAPGFEVIAMAVTKTLEGLGAIGLTDGDRQEAEAVATEILEEVTQDHPSQGKIKRGLMALKGFLAPVAAGISVGAGEGAKEWARTAIEQLGQ
jgi:hypothetical protein